MDLEFNTVRAIEVLLFVACLCFWNLKNTDIKEKFFYLLFYFFLFIYAGIGGALLDVNTSYLIYFSMYVLVLAVIFKKFKYGLNISSIGEKQLDHFISKYASKILIIYFVLKVINLIYPENNIINLISPPPPDLRTHSFTEDGGVDPISQILYLIQGFLTPFFYWSLIKYNKKRFKQFLFLFMDLYLLYCINGYIGRNSILVAILIFVIPYFISASKLKRKVLIALGVGIMPLLLFFFYAYSMARLGNDYSNTSVNDAITILFGQEIGYPRWFDKYIDSCGGLISEYILWILLLPLPGFLKFGLGTMPINRTFSIQMTGLEPGDNGFFVVLPGLVGEGIFAFGSSFFVLHAIILGIVIKYVLNSLKRAGTLTYVYVYYIVNFSFILCRAGTVAVYPLVFKYFLIIYITIIHLLKKK